MQDWKNLGLDHWLIELCGKIGYKKPTTIQKRSIPLLLKNKNLLCIFLYNFLVHSETGSGKTAAFAFPMLQKLFRDPRGIYAVVVAPAREVAIQLTEQISFFGSANQVRCLSVYGGVSEMSQKIELEDIPHIIVGTPGRLATLLKKSKKAQKYLKNCEYLIIDEADRMADPTLQDFIFDIINLVPDDVQHIFSSATIDESDLVFLNKLKKKPNTSIEKISTIKALEKAKSITLKYLLMPEMVKDGYLVGLLKKYKDKEIIIFFNSCE